MSSISNVDFLVSVKDALDSFVPVVRDLLPRVQSQITNQMFAVFALTAVGIKATEALLQNGARGFEIAINEVLNRILIIFILAAVYFNSDVIYTVILNYIKNFEAIMLGYVKSVGYWGVVERCFELMALVSAAVLEAPLHHLKNSVSSDWKDLLAGLWEATKESALLLVKAPMAIIFSLILVFVIFQLIVIYATMQMSIAFVYATALFLIPFGAFHWGWANKFFFAWVNLLMFTVILRILLFFVLVLVDGLVGNFTDQIAILGANNPNARTIEILDIVWVAVVALLLAHIIGYAVSIASSLSSSGVEGDRGNASLPPGARTAASAAGSVAGRAAGAITKKLKSGGV